jgi:Helix-turn-helix
MSLHTRYEWINDAVPRASRRRCRQHQQKFMTFYLHILDRYAVMMPMPLSLPHVEIRHIAFRAVKEPLVAAQCRAARGLLNWSQDMLAEASKVGISTVGDFERDRRTPHDHLLRDMRSALESAGVEFIAENCEAPGGAGVRLKK